MVKSDGSITEQEYNSGSELIRERIIRENGDVTYRYINKSSLLSTVMKVDYYSDKTVERSEWSEGLNQGYTEIFYPDGKRLIWESFNGMKYGKHKVILSDGTEEVYEKFD